MSGKSRIKAVLFPVFSVFIGLFLAILVLEIFVRFFPVFSNLYAEPVNAQQPVLRFLPNREFTFSKDWNFRLVNAGHINNFGFINEQEYNPAATSPLAAVIGDSFVEAAMVPYSKTVQGRLAESTKGKGRVYSFGKSGAPLSQYLAWATWVRKTFKPDLLVFTIIGNDFDESLLRYKSEPGFHYFDDSQENMPLVRMDLGSGFRYKLVRLSSNLALSRYIRQNLGLSAIIFRLRNPDLVYVGNVVSVVDADRIKRSKRVVDVFLARLSQETGIPARRIVFVVDGIRPNLYSQEGLRDAQGSYFETMRTYFLAQSRKQGYATIDMQPRFIARHRATRERFEYPEDGHWNEAGHGLAAEAVKEVLSFRECFGPELVGDCRP